MRALFPAHRWDRRCAQRRTASRLISDFEAGKTRQRFGNVNLPSSFDYEPGSNGSEAGAVKTASQWLRSAAKLTTAYPMLPQQHVQRSVHRRESHPLPLAVKKIVIRRIQTPGDSRAPELGCKVFLRSLHRLPLPFIAPHPDTTPPLLMLNADCW